MGIIQLNNAPRYKTKPGMNFLQKVPAEGWLEQS